MDQVDETDPVILETLKENAQKFYISYKRQATGAAWLWAIFTCGYVVLNVIAFIQPQWIERIDDDHIPSGYFGLYHKCLLSDSGNQLRCSGSFGNFASIDNEAFRASTFFIGVSCLIVFICIGLFLLFFVFNHAFVFGACGVLQFVSGFFMFLGCIIYPAGWKSEEVQNICGSNTESFVIGDCRIGWAYILAIVGIFDALFLAVLGLSLALRQENWIDNNFEYETAESDSSGFIDDTSSSKPSFYIQPTFINPDEDRFSVASRSTKLSKQNSFVL